jgi:hypothetical protein
MKRKIKLIYKINDEKLNQRFTIKKGQNEIFINRRQLFQDYKVLVINIFAIKIWELNSVTSKENYFNIIAKHNMISYLDSF